MSHGRSQTPGAWRDRKREVESLSFPDGLAICHTQTGICSASPHQLCIHCSENAKSGVNSKGKRKHGAKAMDMWGLCWADAGDFSSPVSWLRLTLFVLWPSILPLSTIPLKNPWCWVAHPVINTWVLYMGLLHPGLYPQIFRGLHHGAEEAVIKGGRKSLIWASMPPQEFLSPPSHKGSTLKPIYSPKLQSFIINSSHSSSDSYDI